MVPLASNHVSREGGISSDGDPYARKVAGQLTSHGARLETEALRSPWSPVSLPPVEGPSEDKEQHEEAEAR